MILTQSIHKSTSLYHATTHMLDQDKLSSISPHLLLEQNYCKTFGLHFI